MIIAAFAGTGKTTLAAMYPEKVIDFICMPYKYYIPEDFSGIEHEAGKANPDLIMHEEWPSNYVDAIEEAIKLGKILLIPSVQRVRMLLRIRKIPYTLCYPKREAKEEYRQRFFNRKNSELFIQILGTTYLTPFLMISAIYIIGD